MVRRIDRAARVNEHRANAAVRVRDVAAEPVVTESRVADVPARAAAVIRVGGRVETNRGDELIARPGDRPIRADERVRTTSARVTRHTPETALRLFRMTERTVFGG